ncbi:hypothetical protein [Thalassoglobus sp.]|uniref:hypothetical protein n=1 Tax=Thalassoglobus sp. TaxID=2795869 RepID=UPI003AA98CDA
MSSEAPLNPNALTPEQLAMLLSKGSANRWRITAQEIVQDMESGLPTNSDGTLNLMTYSAWLIQQRGRGK